MVGFVPNIQYLHYQCGLATSLGWLLQRSAAEAVGAPRRAIPKGCQIMNRSKTFQYQTRVSRYFKGDISNIYRYLRLEKDMKKI